MLVELLVDSIYKGGGSSTEQQPKPNATISSIANLLNNSVYIKGGYVSESRWAPTIAAFFENTFEDWVW